MEFSCSPGNLHLAVMSDCIAISELSKRRDSCAAAFLCYRCRSDSLDQTNQKLQKYSGVYDSQDVYELSYPGEQGSL